MHEDAFVYLLATEVRVAESWSEFFLVYAFRLFPIILLVGLMWLVLAWFLRRHRSTQERVFAHMENAEAYMAAQDRQNKRMIFLLEQIAGVDPEREAEAVTDVVPPPVRD